MEKNKKTSVNNRDILTKVNSKYIFIFIVITFFTFISVLLTFNLYFVCNGTWGSSLSRTSLLETINASYYNSCAIAFLNAFGQARLNSYNISANITKINQAYRANENKNLLILFTPLIIEIVIIFILLFRYKKYSHQN